MNTERLWRAFQYSVIGVGLAVSFVVAVLPFYGAGYRLAFSLFLVGILPYLVYGTLLPYLAGVRGGVTGGFVLLIDLVTRLPKRLSDDPLAGMSTYWAVPLAMTAVVVAMAWFMGRRPESTDEPALGGELGNDDDAGGNSVS